MVKTMQRVLLALTGVLIIVIIMGLFVFGNDSESEDLASSQDSNIFEEVSALEALSVGAIDGDTLRAEHGIDNSSVAGASREPRNCVVDISLRSIQKDLKIKFSDSETGKLIDKVPFTVSVKSSEGTNIYDDTDRDGIIYIPTVPTGDITVFMSDITEGDATYRASKSQTITVAEKIQYAKIDVSDEIKTEDQVNVAEEDTKVQDVDETTGGADGKSSDAAAETATEPQESYDEDISEDAEDLIAQIEEEAGAAEISRQAQSGTIDRPAEPEQPSNEEVEQAHAGTKGIDVSKHNGNIDWGAVKGAGIDFAIIRCGYRGSSSGALIVDPMFSANINGAKNAGLNVGVYFFSQAVNEAEAVEEASMVLELISPYSLQYPVYIDVEKSNGRGDAISADERTAVTRAFLSTIQNAGYSCGVYSNKLWFENRINTGSLLDYKIWLAQYVDLPTYTATRYDMWQYTSKGQVPGIGGNVDMNVLK
ncbi:GH25 family lysozyme [Butyrivibrio sp. AE3009]|uniref:GH25 family lysozyme n=1 Tax=Butyrivibrio sp. AE3009 TaxID=1280666 RepID=UPI0003B40051|nr:GH25 family lysozyme [Butyrivibrio sp. AE3009]